MGGRGEGAKPNRNVVVFSSTDVRLKKKGGLDCVVGAAVGNGNANVVVVAKNTRGKNMLHTRAASRGAKRGETSLSQGQHHNLPQKDEVRDDGVVAAEIMHHNNSPRPTSGKGSRGPRRPGMRAVSKSTRGLQRRAMKDWMSGPRTKGETVPGIDQKVRNNKPGVEESGGVVVAARADDSDVEAGRSGAEEIPHHPDSCDSQHCQRNEDTMTRDKDRDVSQEQQELMMLDTTRGNRRGKARGRLDNKRGEAGGSSRSGDVNQCFLEMRWNCWSCPERGKVLGCHPPLGTHQQPSTMFLLTMTSL